MITCLLRHRGNTVVRPNFHVYHDKDVSVEDVLKGKIKLRDIYEPKEDSETYWKEQ